MASSRKRYTTAEVLDFFKENDSENEEVENFEETFTEFVGVVVSESEDASMCSDETVSGDTTLSDPEHDLPEKTPKDSSAERDLPERTQKDTSAERDLPEKTQKDISAERDLPEKTQKDTSAERDLPEKTQKDTSTERDLPETSPMDSSTLQKPGDNINPYKSSETSDSCESLESIVDSTDVHYSSEEECVENDPIKQLRRGRSTRKATGSAR